MGAQEAAVIGALDGAVRKQKLQWDVPGSS